VLDTAASGHNTANTVANKINAAASGGHPCTTLLPGAYGAGTAGNILGNRAGYKLDPAGLDSVSIEAGVNGRQALSGILGATAGKSSGFGTNNVVYYAAGPSGTNTPRINASVDNNGDRTATVLSLPT
jgi:hypothetical protein